MASNKGSGGGTVTIAAPGAVSSGDFVVASSLTGVALDDAGSGQDVVIQTQGVFEVRKTANNVAVGLGAKLYAANSANNVTTATGGGRTFVGYALNASPANASTAVSVLLAPVGA